VYETNNGNEPVTQSVNDKFDNVVLPDVILFSCGGALE